MSKMQSGQKTSPLGLAIFPIKLSTLIYPLYPQWGQRPRRVRLYSPQFGYI